jgi:endoglucanase
MKISKLARIFALLLCIALSAGIFAACNQNNDPPSDSSENPQQQDSITPGEDDIDDTEDDVNLGLEEGVRIMEFRELTAEQLMTDMGAGWNVGNALDARRQGGGTPQQQEMAWGNPQTSPEMIQLLVDTGFKTLRVPVTWEAFIGEAPDYIIDVEMMDRVQEVVDYGIDRDLYVILNTHHENWQFPDEEHYEESKAKLIAVWEQIAARFGGYSEKLIFEGMNEPRLRRTPHEWSGGTEEAHVIINSWNQAFVDTVRASAGHNSKRWLMVPTHAASSEMRAIRGFVLPDDPAGRTIVSIHAYVEYHFALDTKSRASRFDPESTTHTFPIDELFRRLEENFLSQGIPVVMGETGCLNKNNYEDRTAWAKYFAAASAAHGVPSIWWDNGIDFSNDGESFGIMDRREAEWWYPDIAQAFVDAFS